jgi:serine protease inhibitor
MASRRSHSGVRRRCTAPSQRPETSTALKPQGDFSGINGRVPPDEASLFISSVLHKAFVDVNEEGTEAHSSTPSAIEIAAR